MLISHFQNSQNSLVDLYFNSKMETISPRVMHLFWILTSVVGVCCEPQ